MKAGEFSRSTVVEPPLAVTARERTGLSQSEFAKLLGVSVRTLQDWEQKRRVPSGAAQTLLKVAALHPDAILETAAQNNLEKEMNNIDKAFEALDKEMNDLLQSRRDVIEIHVSSVLHYYLKTQNYLVKDENNLFWQTLNPTIPPIKVKIKNLFVDSNKNPIHYKITQQPR